MIFRLGYQPGERKLLESSIKEIEVNLCVVAMDGTGTHRTISEALAFASFLVFGGDGFIARDISFVNLAGPSKGQRSLL
ncbi:hypothetical protein IFM89_021315 [Coptis chinensis]|uniref:Uncharacterized protein n=1 Tax=Coptis chinensis TaxID=261450 RepID=A0A835HWE8_9MAGN|nr:hypothetical protein IFM89_021315 [Coptis chinensis]